MGGFTPLDILYIVLAFCVLWMTAAFFWLVWQVAMILRNVNQTMTVVREKIELMEQAITSMKKKFESATSMIPLIVGGAKKLVDYAVDKKGKIAKKK